MCVILRQVHHHDNNGTIRVLYRHRLQLVRWECRGFYHVRAARDELSKMSYGVKLHVFVVRPVLIGPKDPTTVPTAAETGKPRSVIFIQRHIPQQNRARPNSQLTHEQDLDIILKIVREIRTPVATRTFREVDIPVRVSLLDDERRGSIPAVAVPRRTDHELLGVRIVEYVQGVVHIVPVVVVDDDVRGDVVLDERGSEEALDELPLLVACHDHGGVVRRIQRLVLHRQRMDGDAFVCVRLDKPLKKTYAPYAEHIYHSMDLILNKYNIVWN